jgi:hypothetical protein
MAPDTIILDTQEVMNKIRHAASVSDCQSYAPHVPQFLQELTDVVVDSLKHRAKAGYELSVLVDEIRTGQCHSPSGGFIPAEFADLVHELGTTILRQLDENKAYNLQQTLPYHYWIPPWKVGFDDVMLQRTREIEAK